MIEPLPGTPQHQALLRQITAYYRDDPRMLALTYFGSLARGSWDHHSDLDLDVVLCDGVKIDVLAEVEQLCATFEAIGERLLLLAPDGEEAADVVLASLRELSIRYHPLATTNPNIVESVKLLTGTITLEQIKAAGAANARAQSNMTTAPLDTFARLALAVDRELHRRRLWHILPLLDHMRAITVDLFARRYGNARPYSIFQAYAPATLRDHLGATLPQATLASAQRALLRLLDMIEQQPEQLNLHVIPAAHQTIFVEIRRRQATLDLGVVFDQQD